MPTNRNGRAAGLGGAAPPESGCARWEPGAWGNGKTSGTHCARMPAASATERGAP